MKRAYAIEFRVGQALASQSSSRCEAILKPRLALQCYNDAAWLVYFRPHCLRQEVSVIIRTLTH